MTDRARKCSGWREYSYRNSLLVYSVGVSNLPDFRSEFPGMFNTKLGKVDCSIGIEIKDNAVLKSLYTARKVAYPLLSSIKEL